MKHYISTIIALITVMAFTSCGSDMLYDEPTQSGSHTCRMDLDGSITGYDSQLSSRGVEGFSTKDTLYVYFNTNGGDVVSGVCSYIPSERQWQVSYDGELKASGTCRIYYIKNAKSVTPREITFKSETELYGTESGSYTYNLNSGVKVTATLKPLLSRVCFKGDVGRYFAVCGPLAVSKFSVTTGTWTNSSLAEYLTVSSTGSTPYIYYQGKESNILCVRYGSKVYNITNPINSKGNIGSGYIDIPTEESCVKKGWEMHTTPQEVDLGLSVKWANINICADSPEQSGDYFAWGELTAKTGKESWNEYRHCNGSSSNFTKYCTGTEYGYVDHLTTLEPADDVAHARWGGSWRMPTSDEFKELVKNCTWSKETINGVKCYLVTSKINGNSITLPMAGYKSDGGLTDSGKIYYWSSTLNPSISHSAYYQTFTTSDGYCLRYYCLPVRPVCQ